MIFLWSYIEDLASKGLGFVFISKLLFYASASAVPMALPVAVLLSSMMTTGSFAESIELAAAKSAGISLSRFVRPLMTCAILVGVFAFFFANNMLPVANYKLKNLKNEIARKMPALAIEEGVYFDGLKDQRGGGFTLMVEKKEADQKTFYGLVVYDHTSNTFGAENIIKASKGDINISEDGNYMVLNLFNGVRYSDVNFYSRKQSGYPFSREFFKEQHIIIDISQINNGGNNNNNYIGNQYTMMTITQLDIIRDEIKQDIKKTSVNFINGLSRFYDFIPAKDYQPNGNEPINFNNLNQIDHNVQNTSLQIVRDTAIPQRVIPKVTWGKAFLNVYTPQEKTEIKNTAITQVSNIRSAIEQQINTVKSKNSNAIRNRIEFNRKFTLSIACILLFFIGAPLGAIVRKGGLGLPLIFSIIIFIVYYVVSTIFEKSVRSASIDIIGMWFSSFILLPFGLFLTLKASSDSSIFVLSTYTKPFRRIIGKQNGK